MNRSRWSDAITALRSPITRLRSWTRRHISAPLDAVYERLDANAADDLEPVITALGQPANGGSDTDPQAQAAPTRTTAKISHHPHHPRRSRIPAPKNVA